MISGSRHHPPARIIADGAEHTRSSRSRPRTVPTHLGCSSRRLSRRSRRTTRSWAWRRLRRETGGFRYRSDASSSSTARPIKHGMSGVGCTLEGLERNACKCRWHRVVHASENRSKIGACGGFYGAGLEDVTRNTDFQYSPTNLELSQSLVCSPATSCHVEVAANLPKHADIRLLPSKAMLPALWHVSLLSCAHATKAAQTMVEWSPSDEVGRSMTVARATCLPPQASPCPRACSDSMIIIM